MAVQVHIPDVGSVLVPLGRRSFRIGRAAGCQLTLHSFTISRVHAEIVPDGRGGHLIRDLGSANGTFVEDERIATDHPLARGQVIRVGEIYLTYRPDLEDEPETERPTNLEMEALDDTSAIPLGEARADTLKMESGSWTAERQDLIRRQLDALDRLGQKVSWLRSVDSIEEPLREVLRETFEATEVVVARVPEEVPDLPEPIGPVVHEALTREMVVRGDRSRTMACPVLLHDVPRRAIAVRSALRTYGRTDLLLLGILANQVGVILDNRELLAEKERVLHRLARAHADLADGSGREDEEAVRILGRVAHDLRAPLTGILGLCQLVMMELETEDPDPDERLTDLQRIEESSLVMKEMVERMLDYAQLESGRVPLEREEVDAVEVARVALELLEAEADEADVELVLLDPPAGDTTVRADDLQLRRLLQNLVGNAVRHSPAGAPVRVGSARAGDRVVLSVRDEGPGIPEDLLPVLFEPFARGDDPGRGVGLGLAICREIVQAHGGTIQAENVPGSGARFRVTLPTA